MCTVHGICLVLSLHANTWVSRTSLVWRKIGEFPWNPHKLLVYSIFTIMRLWAIHSSHNQACHSAIYDSYALRVLLCCPICTVIVLPAHAFPCLVHIGNMSLPRNSFPQPSLWMSWRLHLQRAIVLKSKSLNILFTPWTARLKECAACWDFMWYDCLDYFNGKKWGLISKGLWYGFRSNNDIGPGSGFDMIPVLDKSGDTHLVYFHYPSTRR